VQIDWLAFPHIFDAILSYTDDAGLAVLRQTCHDIRQQAYPLLLERVRLVPRALPQGAQGAALISASGVPLFCDCQAAWGCQCDSAALRSGAHSDGTAVAKAWTTPTTSLEVVGPVPAYAVAGLVSTMQTAPDWVLRLRPGALDAPFVMPSVHVPLLEVHMDLLDACAPGFAPRLSSGRTVIHLSFSPDDIPSDPADGERVGDGPLAHLAEHTGEVTIVFHPEARAGRKSKGRLPWLWGDLVASPMASWRYTIVNAESLPLDWMDEKLSAQSRGRARRSIGRYVPSWWSECMFNERFRFLSLGEYEAATTSTVAAEAEK
jgi:hypothetical protein